MIENRIMKSFLIASLTIVTIFYQLYLNKNTTCLQIVQKPSGDTLVKGNIMNGLYYKNFNFISVTEKYLQGHNSLNSKLLITIYTNYDSSNQKVDAYVLKTYSCNTNYIDYISWIRDEKPKKPLDKTKPFIYHPVSGKINIIKHGVVIRKKIDDIFAKKILENALNITEWRESKWDEKSIVNFSIKSNDGEGKLYFGNCNERIPKTILTLFNDFGIQQIN